MRNQTAREPIFPVACARCGGRISEPVTFCPHCGTHARFALAGRAAHAGIHQHDPRGTGGIAHVPRAVPSPDFEDDLDAPWPGPPTPLFATFDGGVPYGEARGSGSEPGRGLKKGTVLVFAAFAVLYAGVIAVHRFGGQWPLSPPASPKAVEGTIGPNGTGDGNLSMPPAGPRWSTSGLHASENAGRYVPANPSDGGSGRSGNDAANGSLDDNGSTSGAMNATSNLSASTPPNTATRRVQQDDTLDAPPQAGSTAREPRQNAASAKSGARDSSVSDRTQGDGQAARSGRAAASRAVATAETQLAKSDLKGARASIDRALAADPSNSEALGVRDELQSREQERDTALTAARACVVQSRWNCVWHNAGNAMAADASSAEASALVNRAIIESGAAVAPAGPGPDNVQVPMVQ